MCFSVQVMQKLGEIVKTFDALVDQKSFEQFETNKQKYPELFKGPDEDQRIYPNVFAPVVMEATVHSERKRVIRPMRYRVRPSDAEEEIPSKFNVFNARLDSLEKRKTWRPLFGRQHGLFPFVRFYEWVTTDNGKELVSFKPLKNELMWAPALFDFYEDGEKSFYSFALITDEPPQEVEAAGHDRCPIFLKEDQWEKWLNPKSVSKEELYQVLSHKEEVTYGVAHEGFSKKRESSSEKQSNQLKLF